MGRSPLPINSNYYCLDQNWHPTYDQASRYCHYHQRLVVVFVFFPHCSGVTGVWWLSVTWEQAQISHSGYHLGQQSWAVQEYCFWVWVKQFQYTKKARKTPKNKHDCAVICADYFIFLDPDSVFSLALAYLL